MPPRNRNAEPTTTATGRKRPPGFIPKKEPSAADVERGKKAKGVKKGELFDKIVTPENRAREGKICGAARTGKSAAGPGICCQPAGWGTNHRGYGRCRLHGGLMPTHEESAEREEAIDIATKAVQLYGAPIDIDPIEALKGLLQGTAGHVAWLADFIKDLDEPTKLKQTTDIGVKPTVWLELYERERRMLLDISKVAIAAGLKQREIAIEEEKGRMLAQVIQAVLMDEQLGLTPAQRVVAPEVVRAKIMEIVLKNQNALEAANV